MDGSRFDTLVRLVTAEGSRRRLLKASLVPAVAGIGAVSLLGIEDGEAKKKKKKCKKSGKPCSKNKQCCPGKTNRICDVPQNASNSDTKCCGAEGAKCGGVDDEENFLPPFCCIGEAGVNAFICSERDPNNPNTPGTCEPAPEEP
jgi:hypothetical protein